MSAPEEWRPVGGYEGWYEVSDAGRICRVRSFSGAPRRRPLKIGLNTSGYLSVRLSIAGVSRNCRVHSLVAAAFLGPRPPGLQVNHKDGVKANAALSNLEYVTPGENQRHAVRTGLRPLVGIKQYLARLAAQDAAEARP